MSEITDLQIETFNDLKEEGLVYEGTLKRKSFGAYDVSSGGRTITFTSSTCQVLFTRLSKAFSMPKYVELREGDKLCVCATNGVEPLRDDEVLIGDETYNVNLSIDMSAGSSSLLMMVIHK
jgi:hypothetical protein